MAMIPNTEAFTCAVCQQLYTQPVVHRLCGLSFDRTCLKDRCPGKQCGRAIVESDLVVNHDLLKIVDEYRFRLETPTAYYLILLDTSTSMWYSDALIPFAFGESRFILAKKFLNAFFEENFNSSTDQVSLVTFDTATIQRFDFETIQTKHIEMLKELTCDGKHTALFDSIDYCLDLYEKFNCIPKNSPSSSYLLILTDGGNNFGKKESDQALRIEKRSRQLQISGHLIQVGDTNSKRSRTICDKIKYKFNHFHGGNIRDCARSLSVSIKTETRAHISKLRNRMTRRVVENTPTLNSTANLLHSLPDVPTTPIKTTSRNKVYA